MGNTAFYAVDFRTRKNHYVNYVLAKRKLWFDDDQKALARAAELALPKRNQVTSLQADYDIKKRIEEHEKLAMSYIDQTVSNALGTLTNVAKRKATEVLPDENGKGKVQKATDGKSNHDNDSDLEAIGGDAKAEKRLTGLRASFPNADAVKNDKQTGLNLDLPASILADLVSQAADKIERAVICASENSAAILNCAKEATSAAKASGEAAVRAAEAAVKAAEAAVRAAEAATAAAYATKISSQLAGEYKELQIELGRYNKRQVYELAVKKQTDERHAAALESYHTQVHHWEVGGRQWARPMPPIPPGDRPNYSDGMRTMWSGSDLQLMQETATQLAGYEAAAVQSAKAVMATAYGDASKDIAHSYRPRQIPSLSFTSHLEEAGTRAMGRRFKIPPYDF